MKRGELHTSDEAFYEKYGFDPNKTGRMTPEMKCQVAKCAILTEYGGKYDGDLVDELVHDAYAECLEAELDETFPFRSQASFLYSKALGAALKSLRKLGKYGGHVIKTINDSDLWHAPNLVVFDSPGGFNRESFIDFNALDPNGETGIQRFEDEDESAAIRAQFERIKFLPAERTIVQGLFEGRTCAEIATELGVSRERVKQRVQKIREKLRRGAPDWFKEKIETICLNQKRRLSRIEASKKRGESF